MSDPKVSCLFENCFLGEGEHTKIFRYWYNKHNKMYKNIIVTCSRSHCITYVNFNIFIEISKDEYNLLRILK